MLGMHPALEPTAITTLLQLAELMGVRDDAPIRQRLAAVKAELASLDTRRAEVAGLIVDHDRRVAAAVDAEAKAREAHEALDARHADLANQATWLADRAHALGVREAELDERSRSIAEDSAAAAKAIEEAHAAADAAIEERRHAVDGVLAARSAALDERERVVAHREQAVEAEHKRLRAFLEK